MYLAVELLAQLPKGSFYVVHQGQVVQDHAVLPPGTVVDVRVRLCGGKGGFGSILRSSGSQYNKAQNQDSCRDLSGRRLRDVEEEKKLKKWVEKAGDRARERAEKRREKLDRLARGPPKPNFQDEQYSLDKRSIMEQNAEAVEAGIAALSRHNQQKLANNDEKLANNDEKLASSDDSNVSIDDMPGTSGTNLKSQRKRPLEQPTGVAEKSEKKMRGEKFMWTGIDEADLSSSSEEDDDEASGSCLPASDLKLATQGASVAPGLTVEAADK